MLSISFGEILLIAAVGLVVIGPKRLPQAARFAGHLFGRVQRQIRTVKDDIKREMDAADLQSIQQEYQKAAQKAGENAGDIFQSIKQTAAEATGDVHQPAAADNQTPAVNNKGGNDNNNNGGGNNNHHGNKNTEIKKPFPPPHTAPSAPHTAGASINKTD